MFDYWEFYAYMQLANIAIFVLGDVDFQLKNIRCLALLLIFSKTKRPDRDIPILIKFVEVSIQLFMYSLVYIQLNVEWHTHIRSSGWGEQSATNSCYQGGMQWSIFYMCGGAANIRKLRLPSAIFLVMASHYIFNLSYNSKVEDSPQ